MIWLELHVNDGFLPTYKAQCETNLWFVFQWIHGCEVSFIDAYPFGLDADCVIYLCWSFNLMMINYPASEWRTSMTLCFTKLKHVQFSICNWNQRVLWLNNGHYYFMIETNLIQTGMIYNYQVVSQIYTLLFWLMIVCCMSLYHFNSWPVNENLIYVGRSFLVPRYLLDSVVYSFVSLLIKISPC